MPSMRASCAASQGSERMREASRSRENGRMERQTQIHTIAPVFDARSRVLILGSFPSVRSRAAAFYYAHPRNRFWPVLAAVLDEPTPETAEEKRAMLLRRRVALWDVVASCRIAGSSDASIENVRANDLRRVLDAAPIEAIFCNGGTAYRYYQRLCRTELGWEARLLPSTSPANARCTLARLTQLWSGELSPLLHGDARE